MRAIRTHSLLRALSIRKIVGSVPNSVDSIHCDSREVIENSLFVCIKGYTVDGHCYIDAAIEKGATIIIVEEMPEEVEGSVCYVQVNNSVKALAHLASTFYGHPSSKLSIIGVTGTNGKTTVSTIINNILRQEGYKTGLCGTIEIDINGKKLPSKNTTNDSLTLQRVLHDMVENGVTDVVLEVSSHGLLQGRLSGVDFQTGVFTNLTRDHLDYHGTMENYKNVKGLLFSQLGQDFTKQKMAVLNADDEASTYYEQITGANVITYGIKNDADLKANNIQYKMDHTLFRLNTPNGTYDVVSPLVGEFNVYNLLAAIAALSDKLSIPTIIKSIKNIHPPIGRMQKLVDQDPCTIIVDYAHTEDAIKKVLHHLKMFYKRKIISVIGTGGNRDKGKRPRMGEVATEHSDYVIFTTNNPLDEPLDEITNGLAEGAVHDQYECIGDRRMAIYRAVQLAGEGDVVLIAGKGHDKFQIIGNNSIPFYDSEVAVSAWVQYHQLHKKSSSSIITKTR
ncbi:MULTISPECIES: UDP-N-acetylmuramoyl-L-alanyl-D-glutamate--2,6-diaminopimelate ligase [Sutcliffiella]|uniref:UDP-N-acetylmuramoyl-L-alanyl-D-glutamate--2, 6-diaminopimelate ligase n=1 Tax=Sutcliffiella TaxID=2837511 RepID=UPI0008312B70|nr:MULTISPECIES: UDP-N-acetylmuramoyl-L-alanyl-D-glutamate--2,6-diaminopimelate ligase [Sutcliffiella]WBL17271.1 UDP-N-acetylmuramoyl-L-alanyl-D-glutamate--2,6-diaminopimelate ligase [Sutcliffiella sp. NC1]